MTDVCLFMCLYMCTDIYIYTYDYVAMSPLRYISISVYVCIYIYVRVYVYIYVSVYVYMCMSVHVCARDTRLRVRERVPENAHPCIHARAHTHSDPGADGTDIRCAGTKISMRNVLKSVRV